MHGQEQTISMHGQEQTISMHGQEQTISMHGQEQTISMHGQEQTISMHGQEQTISMHGQERWRGILKLHVFDGQKMHNVMGYRFVQFYGHHNVFIIYHAMYVYMLRPGCKTLAQL